MLFYMTEEGQEGRNLSTRNVSLISANLNGIRNAYAQVYRWQIPMDAGVVLRDRR